MEGNPNLVAWLALLLVPVAAFVAFSTWNPLKAAAVVVIGGNLLLPCVIGINLPVLPSLDKQLLPSLWALIACAVLRPTALRARLFRGPEILLLVACCGTLGTTWTNPDPLVYGPAVLPGLTLYGAFCDSVAILLMWLPPFFLGRALVRTSAQLRWLLSFFVTASLWYSLLILWEVRMSPQLHRLFYGFHPSEFVQTLRWGGYRPMVFMQHGLNVALFVVLALLVATGLYRAKIPRPSGVSAGASVVILVVVLIVCKSTGAYFVALLALPVFFFASARGQMWFAGGVTVLVLGYPLARSMDWIPIDDIIAWFSENVDQERAHSLWFRFHTEGEILDHIRERIWFGWGTFGRNHIYDTTSGLPTSVLDGLWVIMMSVGGVVGWASLFGMVTLPILNAVWKLRLLTRPVDRAMIATLAVVCALYVFDWVPNASRTAELTFMVGALAGAVPGILAEQRRGFAGASSRNEAKPLRPRPRDTHLPGNALPPSEEGHVS